MGKEKTAFGIFSTGDGEHVWLTFDVKTLTDHRVMNVGDDDEEWRQCTGHIQLMMPTDEAYRVGQLVIGHVNAVRSAQGDKADKMKGDRDEG